MSLDKFWLQFNNGKKDQLNDIKHGVRKDQVDSKYHNLFDGYDANHDGTLEAEELKNILSHFKKFAGEDKTLDDYENAVVKSVFENQIKMKDADFMGFMKSLSDASVKILSSKEKSTKDGGKEITTEYEDGTTETIAYYSNGDFKWKKIHKRYENTTYEIEINGQKKEITKEEFEQAKEKIENQGKVSVKKGAEGQQQMAISGVSSDNVKISSNSTKGEDYKEEFSPRFIAEMIGVDIRTEEGIKILERLSCIPKEALAKIKDGKEINEILVQNDLQPDFDTVSNVLELVYGLTLRDEEEFEASKSQREELITRVKASELLTNLYETIAAYNDMYTDSQGLFGLGAEGFGYLLNKLGIDGENHYQWASSCREFAKKASEFKVLNPEKFDEDFKALTGNKFDLKAFKNILTLVEEGKHQDEEGNFTEEYKNAIKKATNFEANNPNEMSFVQSLLPGFGEALIMIVTLGWGAETQAGKTMAMSTMSTFSRLGVEVASKQAKNKLLQGALRLSGKGIKLIGPALNEGTKMYLYTAATGTAANLANRGIKFDSEENTLARFLETEGMVLDGAIGSFGFGAFAGVFGSTVTQKVMQSVSRVSTKVGNALADKLSKGAIDASDVYITILEKSAPTKIAEVAAFAADVLGFTAFESALAIAKNLNGFPDNVTVEDITNVIWEEFKGQGVNLGQIKGVSYLIMFLTGSRSARMQASQYMRENLPQLRGTKVEKTDEGYKINLPNGRSVECKNASEMITSLHLMVRCETVFSKKFDIKYTETKAPKKAETSGKHDVSENLPQITTEKSELREKARTENPAVVAESKVREEWQQHDLQTKTPEEGVNDRVDLFNLDPEAGLKESGQDVHYEVTDLILKGKLGETLTKKYEHANEVFKEILDKHKNEIEELANKYRFNNRLYAQGIIDIFLKEFGMQDVELKARLVAKDGGGCNWHDGTIDVSDMIADKNELAELISHEFVHLLQFREVLAEYGTKGLQQLIIDNKSMETWEKQILVQRINSNPKFFIQMLSNVKGQQSDVGSINYYLRKIYQKETANPKPVGDGEAYFNELIEREAYRLGSNGHNLDIKLKELSPEEAAKLKAENDALDKKEGIAQFYNPETGNFEFPKYEPEEEQMGVFALTGKESLETLLKVKEQVDKFVADLDTKTKDNEKFKEAYKEYQTKLDNAIELAKVIEKEESLSNIEKEFQAVDKTSAEEAIGQTIDDEKNSKDYYIRLLVDACTIENKVCRELVQRTVNLMKANNIDKVYDIQELIQCFKSQYGIDRGAIEKYEELTNNNKENKDNVNLKTIKECKDEDGRFRFDYYEKYKQIESNDRSWAHNVLNRCKVTRKIGDAEVTDISEELWSKALELKGMGFDNYNISSLMGICRETTKNSYELGEFSQERFELIKELKDKYHINLENINEILDKCVNDGEFNYNTYKAALMMVSHINDSDISYSIRDFERFEDKELALKHIIELQKKYNFESRRIAFIYRKCCDEIKLNDKEKTFKFNQTKYDKAIELKTKYNMDDYDIEQYLKVCTVDGKFEESVYNKLIEYKKYGLDESDFVNIIEECIHSRPGEHSWEHTIIDYKLMDKIGVWLDLCIKKLDKSEDLCRIGRYLSSILEFIDSKECEATDYIEKFIKAGIKDIPTKMREASVRDKNGYITEPRHYNQTVMDAMIEWAEKYKVDDDNISIIMHRINNQIELSKKEAIGYINQLLEAGWDPKAMDELSSVIVHWGHDRNTEFNLPMIELFTENLKKGYDVRAIAHAVFKCSGSDYNDMEHYYDFYPEKFEKLMDMVGSCPKEYQFEAVGWMHNLVDCSEAISETIKEGKVPFEKYYQFAMRYLNSVEYAHGPEKRALRSIVAEQIRKTPESFEDIKDIFLNREGFPHNEKYFNFCFNHLKDSEWKTCLECIANTTYGRYNSRERIIDILSMLDTNEIPLYEEWGSRNITRCADDICANISRYDGDGTNKHQYCPEVIAKLKELMITGNLEGAVRSTAGSTVVFDNPEFCKVLDALAKAEREGLPPDVTYIAFFKIRGGNDKRDNYFAKNYQEIINFFIRHKDELGSGKKLAELKHSTNIYVRDALKEAERQEEIRQVLSFIKTEDTEVLEKVLKYSKILANPKCIKIITNQLAGDPKPLLDFLDKVDFSKYKNEVESLFNYICTDSNYAYKNVANSYLLFHPDLSKESLEYILDTEKFLNEKFFKPELHDGYLSVPDNAMRLNRPHLTNKFFQLFTDGDIPEEALNKFRYYLEYQTSLIEEKNKDDIPFEVVGSKQKNGTEILNKILDIIKIYKQRPNKIELFEKYLFGDNNEEEIDNLYGVISCLSDDKEILNKQIDLLDDIIKYDSGLNTRYRIQEVFYVKNPEELDARIEVWNTIKPEEGKKLKKGEIGDILYKLSHVTENNKDVVIYASKDSRFDNTSVTNLAYSTKADNHDLIYKMMQDEKYPVDFIIQMASHTYSDYHTKLAELMLKDGSFPNDIAINILNATRENSYLLAQELCFNKELKFPKEHIFDILWSLTDANTAIAWKLCTNKNRVIPADKISLAMKCCRDKEINPDMFINKFKMLLDLGFSDNFIQSVLGTSGSLSRYTKNFCTVLQHLREKGAKAERCVEILTADSISDNITKNIYTLEVLNMLDGEDIQLLKADGIDVYSKIQRLQKAIAIKYPIIETPEGAEVGTLKALANNKGADDVIKNMDLTQFESKNGGYNGIRLQYSREEFIDNMNRLITAYTSGENEKLKEFSYYERKEIPALELSETSKEKVEQKIEEFKQTFQNKNQHENIIMDGQNCQAVRFMGSKGNGSNPGDYYLIDGKLYYVKLPNSNKLGQSVEEVIASRLYRAAGIDAPNEHYIYNEQGGVIGMASEYIPDMEARHWNQVGEDEAKQMFESFAVDAWLANWDAPKNDNTQIYEDGKIIKSDVGGSLHYRARGDIKENFNGVVIELLTLIENNSVLYSKMTKEDVMNSIKRVLDIPDATIYQTIMEAPSHDAKLAETMIRRKAYMKSFYENLEKLDGNGQNVVDLIIEAQGKTTTEFKEIPDIAGAFGYIPTENGFEGLLNTQGYEKLDLTPEQRVIADKMKAEIERFTMQNRVADSVDVPDEVSSFVNGILQGIPEFAAYFGKPQHGNGELDSDGKQIAGHQYSLDIHILNVLQKSLKNPLYDAVDEYGFKLLDDESKIVLKFSTLLHDIGKIYMSGKDEGHAARSAEYVYSILDRFNLPTRVKNRIVNIINNHHWFEQLCTNVINENQIAATFRTTADFTIARIMAQADLESVYEGYFTSRMSRNFPSEVSNEESAYKKFNKIMDGIQEKVNKIEETSAVVTPSKFVEIPEHIGSDGKVVPRRGFPIVEFELDGKIEQFQILNLHELDPETDMYQYGFSHIKLKDLKLLVHRFGDGEWGKFTTTKLLGDNPMRFSVQSLSLINPAHTSAYSGRNFSCIVEGNNANIGVAYYKNAGTGTWKNLNSLIEEMMDPYYEKKRNFFKNTFIKYMEEQKGIKIDDKMYGVIMRYARNKQYIETQLKDLNLGSITIKREDLVDGLLYAQDFLIEKQKDENYERHNEETEIDCKVIAGGGSMRKTEDLKDKPDFLRICRDNCNGRIILW